MLEFDSEGKPLEDHEYPDDYDSDHGDDWDETDVAACPTCGAEIADDSVRCPICGEYVTFGTSIWQGKSWWWIVAGVVGVAATVISLALL